jgi:hypothetical protein
VSKRIGSAATGWRQGTALAAALCLLLPFAALPAQAQIFGGRQQQPQPQQRRGMSTGKKVATVAGLALLYYLYRKHSAKQKEEQRQQQAQAGQQGGGMNTRPGTMVAQRPQLYRSKNGGVYYRDPQNPKRVVWLTVPKQPVRVPVEELQRYAPDYARYRGTAPAAPAGYRTQSFQQFAPDLYDFNSGNNGGNVNSRNNDGYAAPTAPGPRGPRGGDQ